MDRIDAFIANLGLPDLDRALLTQALTHASWVHEHPEAATGHNERLEFLGDAVIGMVVARELYERYPDDDEGLLSARRAGIVSATGLARIATRLRLGDSLHLGLGESLRDARIRPSLLAAALEAVVGAIYLGLGWEVAARWVTAQAQLELSEARAESTLKSPKSRLQELTQRTSGTRPDYQILEAVGPDHDRVFRIEVRVDGRGVGTGVGSSRRAAETNAAAEALELLAGTESHAETGGGTEGA